MPCQYGRAVEPHVLRPMAVGFLRHLEVSQYAPDMLVGTHRDEAAGGLDEVARPHQVVTTKVVVGLGEAPRNRQAGDDPAFHALGFVRAQHRGAGVIQRTSRLRWYAAFEPRVPGFPRSDVCRLCLVEIFEEANERVLTRFHRRGTETEGHHERAVR